MGVVLAVCVVHELRRDASSIGVTAIDKRPVDHAVRVHKLGLRGDVQADRKNHGGLDKAVYAYSQQDADWWSAELGRPLPAGWFGENLRVDGIEVSQARVGERWRVGDDGLVLEVSEPRGPCQTFARWVGGEDERGWVKRFADVRRLGTYLRVVRTGSVRAGDDIELIAHADDAPTVAELYRVG